MQEADPRQGSKSRDDLAASHQISKILSCNVNPQHRGLIEAEATFLLGSCRRGKTGPGVL
jgi:2-polyprenyl-3-methyl-5-hydroxy-6-metoxy-1,4-benzoquinol methylase